MGLELELVAGHVGGVKIDGEPKRGHPLVERPAGQSVDQVEADVVEPGGCGRLQG